MKTDRLLGITVYLLRHGLTSANALAERFEVSLRTIQRDAESLSRAGIPIYSRPGAGGGYGIMEEYRLEHIAASAADVALIQTALEGLHSAHPNARVRTALEKVSLLSREPDQALMLDFGVLHEDGELCERLSLLEEAIAGKRTVSFDYTDARGVERARRAEPVSLVYRWYAWYLLAYAPERADYRTFKLARMRGLRALTERSAHVHPPVRELLARGEAGRTYIDAEIRCEGRVRAKAMEYLRGRIVAEEEDGACRMRLHLPEDELVWFGVLLALGDGVRVIAPKALRERVAQKGREILKACGE